MLVFISIVVIAIVVALVYNNNKKQIAETIEKVESTIAPAVKEVKEVAAAKPAAAVAKKITITCAKGKLVKKVSGTTPKCPAGFKKK